MTDQDNSYTVSKRKIIEGPEGDQIELRVEKTEEMILILEDGELVGKLKMPSFLVERKFPRSPSSEVIELIYGVRLQIKILWEAMKIDEYSDSQEAAIRFYREQSDWLFGEELLHDEYIYDWRLSQEPGDFRGKLLKKIIKERFPEEPSHGYVKLERIARSFDKK